VIAEEKRFVWESITTFLSGGEKIVEADASDHPVFSREPIRGVTAYPLLLFMDRKYTM
jgi:hypothetical protein